MVTTVDSRRETASLIGGQIQSAKTTASTLPKTAI
jgi:hypothetical protein